MDKIKLVMGFHQPPSTILIDVPRHLIYIKRCEKNVEIIT